MHASVFRTVTPLQGVCNTLPKRCYNRHCRKPRHRKDTPPPRTFSPERVCGYFFYPGLMKGISDNSNYKNNCFSGEEQKNRTTRPAARFPVCSDPFPEQYCSRGVNVVPLPPKPRQSVGCPSVPGNVFFRFSGQLGKRADGFAG